MLWFHQYDNNCHCLEEFQPDWFTNFRDMAKIPFFLIFDFTKNAHFSTIMSLFRIYWLELASVQHWSSVCCAIRLHLERIRCATSPRARNLWSSSSYIVFKGFIKRTAEFGHFSFEQMNRKIQDCLSVKDQMSELVFF